MDCKEFREVLDLYIDNELSPEAMASAGVHLTDCAPCRRATDELFRLRQAVKEAVNKHQPPPALLDSIRRATSASRRRVAVVALTAIALFLVSLIALEQMAGVGTYLASGMEQIAFQLDRPKTVLLEGEIVCRECELYALYGSPKERDVEGHHGALKTHAGKIWNFMKGEKSYPLIHDQSFIGKRVRVRAKLYRRAGCLEVETYEVLQTT